MYLWYAYVGGEWRFFNLRDTARNIYVYIMYFSSLNDDSCVTCRCWACVRRVFCNKCVCVMRVAKSPVCVSTRHEPVWVRFCWISISVSSRIWRKDTSAHGGTHTQIQPNYSNDSSLCGIWCGPERTKKRETERRTNEFTLYSCRWLASDSRILKSKLF